MLMQDINSFSGEFEFLSNFFGCDILYEGDVYPSAEHAYQAAKVLRPGTRRWIRLSRTPGLAKRRGRSLELRPGWEAMKSRAMCEILEVKFAARTALASELLSTGERPLIEGNYWGDTFWGVDMRTGLGQNTLGKLLMAIRENLREV